MCVCARLLKVPVELFVFAFAASGPRQSGSGENHPSVHSEYSSEMLGILISTSRQYAGEYSPSVCGRCPVHLEASHALISHSVCRLVPGMLSTRGL